MRLRFVTAFGKTFFNERELTLLLGVAHDGLRHGAAQPIRDDGRRTVALLFRGFTFFRQPRENIHW
jgi:hypothetical protein